MGKIYKFKIGIMAAINDSDDLFEIEVNLTDEEHDRVLEAYQKYFWDDDDLAEALRDYYPEMNERIVKLGEPVAIAKWGDAAKLDNGAIYEPCVPEEIEEEYLASDDYKAFKEAQTRMKTNCKQQSNYEHKVLKDGLTEGRWKHFTQAGTFGLFDCFRSSGGMEAYYCMEGQCNGVHIDYCKRYKLKESKMEIEFYGNKAYSKRLIDEYLVPCGREIEVKDMNYKYLVYIPSKEDSSDIEIILPILDRLESDCINVKG